MLISPHVPQGVPCDGRFTVEVRQKPDGEFQPVATYAAYIDMHDVRQCAVGIFDFTGAVEVRIRPHLSWVHSAVVRPLCLGIVPECDGHAITFTLEHPADMMIEVNGERFHCLHLFAGSPLGAPTDHVLWVNAPRADFNTTEVRRLLPILASMPKGRTLAFRPGLHIIDEYMLDIPSDTQVYLAPGAVVVGGLVVQDAENVRIFGHGMIWQRSFHRFSSINGVRISHSKNVTVEGVTFLNPPHYTVHIGGSEQVTIRGLRSFSCEGWSDGIDMMSCLHVHVDGCFLRTSDDCIAIYGSRWEYRGDTRHVLVENCTLWADVAHPTIIGTHGDHRHDGDTIEHVTFRNIDILEHHEYQQGYLGCLAINPGDKNTVRHVLYEDIRVEHIEHGKLFDVQVKFNPDYNPAPGRLIEDVTFRNVRCGCIPPVESVIAGYDAEHPVRNITLEDVTAAGQPVHVQVGQYAENITGGEP